MSDSGDLYFHMSLGPVQSFVAQGRRTRDFWSGSFLLSYLASIAMIAVEAQGGNIGFPVPDSNFLNAIKGQNKQTPAQGNVPNRFKTLRVSVEQGFRPEQVVSVLESAWWALAETIWRADLQPYLSSEQCASTRHIWSRQVKSFWEVNWCLTDDPEATDVLDRRKNWRNHKHPQEPGVKCMMMEGLQEISASSSPHAEAIDDFWSNIREHIHEGHTDLCKGEYLCSLAFIKRRFARHFANYHHRCDNGGQPINIQGWQLRTQVPSVSYLAASPWYAETLSAATTCPEIKMLLDRFLQNAKHLVDYPETATPTAEVAKAVAMLEWTSEKAAVDGLAFHACQLVQGDRRFISSVAARKTHKALQDLRACAKLPEASVFYAVLVLDGDSLGSQMSQPEKQTSISEALQAFTRDALSIVKKFNGFLVYAGGDDVLALMPVDPAIQCAQALRSHYNKCIEIENAKFSDCDHIKTSLSAAIVFAHIRIPLMSVLSDAHQLLAKVAKDQTGRDSVAVRVLKPGGQHLQWSQPWEVIEDGENENLLLMLASRFASREKDSPFTHRFIFKSERLFRTLPTQLIAQKVADGTYNDELIKILLKAELLHSGMKLGKNRSDSSDELDSLILLLLKLTTPNKRKAVNGNLFEIISTQTCAIDGLKLVRFLVQNSIALHMESHT